MAGVEKQTRRRSAIAPHVRCRTAMESVITSQDYPGIPEANPLPIHKFTTKSVARREIGAGPGPASGANRCGVRENAGNSIFDDRLARVVLACLSGLRIERH